MQTQDKVNTLTEHLFRTEYGKMVASLTRIFGIGQMSVAEDIVQDTIVLALKEWSYNPLPPNPTAWLYVVAKNKAIDYLRKEKYKQKLTSDLAYLLESEYTLSNTVNNIFTENEIKDNQLRMMFALCHPSISIEAQVTLILKTLCGFGNDEIARALLTNTETINKRLYRAKEKLREENIKLELPPTAHLLTRLDVILKSIYLLFNEGYNTSSGKNQVLRHDLCFEAMRLCLLLLESENTQQPQTNALLALMCYNASRFNSRTNTDGDIVLYKDQDRSLWDKDLIIRGSYYLSLASAGTIASTYHVEAAIASHYCLAPSFKATGWKEIYSLYELLEKINPSPIVQLNKAIVLAYKGNVDKAIQDVLAISGLEQNHLYFAVLGDLYAMRGETLKAIQHYENALTIVKNPKQKKLLQNKLVSLV